MSVSKGSLCRNCGRGEIARMEGLRREMDVDPLLSSPVAFARTSGAQRERTEWGMD